jgi:CheY-like chemotaxis protein
MSDIANRCDEKRILVVDDKDFVRTSTRDMLIMLGHEVHTASHGGEAFEMYLGGQQDGQYNLIFTDNNMPFVGGIELMRRIVAHGNGVPVVLMSGLYVEESIWVSAGFKHLLPKPFTLDELEACVARYAVGHDQQII